MAMARLWLHITMAAGIFRALIQDSRTSYALTGLITCVY